MYLSLIHILLGLIVAISLVAMFLNQPIKTKKEIRYNETHKAVSYTHLTQGGFGGSNKNIGIGCADGRIGKAMIHTTPGSDDMWDIAKEEFMERMTESAKAVVDHFGDQDVYKRQH